MHSTIDFFIKKLRKLEMFKKLKKMDVIILPPELPEPL